MKNPFYSKFYCLTYYLLPISKTIIIIYKILLKKLQTVKILMIKFLNYIVF